MNPKASVSRINHVFVWFMRETVLLEIALIYEFQPNEVIDTVVALLQNSEDANWAVVALNSKAQEVAKLVHDDDWEEYSRCYYVKEFPVVTTKTSFLPYDLLATFFKLECPP